MLSLVLLKSLKQLCSMLLLFSSCSYCCCFFVGFNCYFRFCCCGIGGGAHHRQILMLQNSSAADALQFFSAFYARWIVLLAGYASLFRFVSRHSYFVFFTHSSYALVPFFSRVLLHKEGRCFVDIFPLFLLGVL